MSNYKDILVNRRIQHISAVVLWGEGLFTAVLSGYGRGDL